MSIMKEAKIRVQCAGRIALAGCSLLALTGCKSVMHYPVGTAFHHRPRLAMERQPYQNVGVLQLPQPVSSEVNEAFA